MSRVITSRRLASVLTGTAVAAASFAVFSAPAHAASVTITKVTPKKVAATTAGASVVITGTGFDDATISQVDLNGAADCSGAGKVTYIVVSSTQIVAKTPTGGCAATGSTTTPETVKIWDAAGTPAVSAQFTGTASTGLFFVAPPVFTGDAAATPKAYLLNSEALANAAPAASSKQVTLNAAGGQIIKVNGSGYAKGLTASLGGKTLGSVTVDSTGNFFTAKTSAIPDSGGSTLALVLTANGVSKSFTTQLVSKNTTSVTSVKPTSVAVGSGATLTISGTGFSTTAADDTVNVCGVAATVTGTPTKTKVTVTLPTVENVSPGLGAGNYEGVCQVTVQNTNGTTPYAANPQTATSVVAVVSQ